ELQRTLGAEETAQLAVLEQARAEATQLRSRADSLRELQARYEGCTRGVASLVGRAPGAAALLASVLRVPKDLERAVAAALGTRLAQVVVPDTAAAIDAVDWLTRTSGGSATVLPREAEPRAPGGRGARPRGAAGTRRRGGACDRRGGRAAARPRRRSGGGGEGPGAAGGRARADRGRTRGGRARGGWARGGGRRGGRGAGRARRATNGCGGGGRRAARAPGGAAGGPHRMARSTCRWGAPADRGRGASGGGLGALARGAGGREPRRRPRRR